MAQVVASLINNKYGREDDLESDRLGVEYMSAAGYDPRAMMRVQEILDAVAGGGRPPEFFSSHPNPENRIAVIQEAMNAKFPGGEPEGMTR